MSTIEAVTKPLAPVTVVKTDAVTPDAVPPTPSALEGAELLATDITERLLEIVTPLGIPIGYPREQGGRIVQDLFPISATARRQVSTSSLVDLGMHTETAFHPYRPDYVVLLCLRGDPAASTTHASIDDVLALLSDADRDLLSQERFVTTVDESFMANGENDHEFVIAPLQAGNDGVELVFDAQLMHGTDPESQGAFDRLTDAVNKSVRSTVLETGDVLIIDNHRAVHGRSRFTPRFDGTDRWLRRVMVLRQPPPPSDFDGRLVTTLF